LNGTQDRCILFQLSGVPPMNDVTRILSAIEQGDPHAADQLLPLVYDALRQLAAQRLSREKPGQTLQATALVHEAYLRLVSAEQRQHWDSRGHFFAAAAEAMRRILIENARRKRCPKHGGGWQRVAMDEADALAGLPSNDLLALDEALTRLAREAPAKAELVKLRYFAGFSIDEAADLLGISRATAKRYWVYARAWLYESLTGADKPDPV
jgi:RNA polymerase sigma factor (TIGR02999 family)